MANACEITTKPTFPYKDIKLQDFTHISIKQAYAQTLDKVWREVTFHIVRPWSGFKKYEKRELNEFYPKIILATLA